MVGRHALSFELCDSCARGQGGVLAFEFFDRICQLVTCYFEVGFT